MELLKSHFSERFSLIVFKKQSGKFIVQLIDIESNVISIYERETWLMARRSFDVLLELFLN